MLYYLLLRKKPKICLIITFVSSGGPQGKVVVVGVNAQQPDIKSDAHCGDFGTAGKGGRRAVCLKYLFTEKQHL